MTALTLAVPSKGRLKDNVDAFFADAGAALSHSARGYRAALAGFPAIEVMLLTASEIAASLISGDVHLGITGHDLLLEQAPELTGRVHLIKPLGFGHADVVVAVPAFWIDVATMADLDDVCAAFAQKHRRRLRVATKYVRLTRSHFARLGISDYRIVESAGATEAAPATGTAEIIVDITSTGSTLKANGLKVPGDGVILKSEAQFAAALGADWSEAARSAAAGLLDRLNARDRARNAQVLRIRIDGDAGTILARLGEETGASLMSRPADASGEYVILCPRPRLMQAIGSLRAQGCDAPVTTQDADYVFDTQNPLYAALASALG
jgi:ATP phosphoribosyltransferase